MMRRQYRVVGIPLKNQVSDDLPEVFKATARKQKLEHTDKTSFHALPPPALGTPRARELSSNMLHSRRQNKDAEAPAQKTNAKDDDEEEEEPNERTWELSHGKRKTLGEGDWECLYSRDTTSLVPQALPKTDRDRHRPLPDACNPKQRLKQMEGRRRSK